MLSLERALRLHADVVGLLFGKFGELSAELLQVQASDLLVERLRQDVDFVLVLLTLGEELDLRQDLVGERSRHHEGRVAGGVAEVQQAAFREQDHAVALRELDHVDLRLDVCPLQVTQCGDLNFVVEVADVADDRHVLHLAHVVHADDVLVAGRRDEDVGRRDDVFELNDFETVHRRLERADRVDFGDLDAGAGAGKRSCRALADVAVTADDGDLAGHHHVGAAADAVNERFLAAVLVVELRLGDRIVDVDRREGQQALGLKLVQAVDAGGGFFGHALDGVALLGEPARRSLEALLDLCDEDLFFFGARVGEYVFTGFGAGAEQDVHGGVATIVEDHVRDAAIGPLEDLVRVGPVFFERFALDGEDRNAACGDGSGSVILGREDVARGPAHVGAEGNQRLDQNGGLDGHVQRAGDARALQRLCSAELFAAGHQARHFRFGDRNFLAPEIGETDVGDDIVLSGGHGILRADLFKPHGFNRTAARLCLPRLPTR
ncbi:hypothetical protein D9M70_366590 [compost metagenome]